MRDLLKDYFENSGIYNYSEVYIDGFDTNGHLCEVRLSYKDSDYECKKTIMVSVWDVLAFIYEKKIATTILKNQDTMKNENQPQHTQGKLTNRPSSFVGIGEIMKKMENKLQNVHLKKYLSE